MVWLIDGNNVMGARPDGWWRDRRAARERLVDQLDEWQRSNGDDAHVIFDGHEDRELTARSRPGLTIGFSGGTGRDSADDAIASVAANAAKDPGRLTVVTSDRGLAGRLPEHAEQLGAGAFRRLLDGAAGELDQGGSDFAS